MGTSTPSVTVVTTTTTRRRERIGSPPYRLTTIGSVALISLFAFEALAVSTAMPVAAAALDGLSLYALAFGAPLAAGVIGMVLGGPWSDRSGPGPATWAGLSAFVLGLLVAGTAQTMVQLVVGRTLLGAGSGLVIVALYVVVARVYPAELHPRIFAAFSTAWVVPSLVGPAAAGLVAEHVGWRWVFLGVPAIAIPATLLLRPALARLTGTGVPPTGGIAPLPWAVLAAVSAGTLHVAGQHISLTGALLLAAGLLGVGVALPRLLPTGTFRAARGLPAVIALRGLFAAAFFTAEVFIPLMLIRERGLSPALAGIALTVGAVSWSVGSNLQARISTPARRPGILRAGAVLILAAVVVSAAAAVLVVPTPVLVVAWGLAGLGMGMAYPTLSMLVLALAPTGRQGESSAALQISDSMTTSIALAVSGSTFAVLITVSAPLAFLAGFALATVFALAAASLAYRVTP